MPLRNCSLSTYACYFQDLKRYLTGSIIFHRAIACNATHGIAKVFMSLCLSVCLSGCQTHGLL